MTSVVTARRKRPTNDLMKPAGAFAAAGTVFDVSASGATKVDAALFSSVTADCKGGRFTAGSDGSWFSANH